MFTSSSMLGSTLLAFTIPVCLRLLFGKPGCHTFFIRLQVCAHPLCLLVEFLRISTINKHFWQLKMALLVLEAIKLTGRSRRRNINSTLLLVSVLWSLAVHVFSQKFKLSCDLCCHENDQLALLAVVGLLPRYFLVNNLHTRMCYVRHCVKSLCKNSGPDGFLGIRVL